MELDTLILIILQFAVLLLLLLFFLGFRMVLSRIGPLLEQFTGPSGKFELPKINIKQAIGYGIYKWVESMDFSKGLQGILGGGKK